MSEPSMAQVPNRRPFLLGPNGMSAQVQQAVSVAEGDVEGEARRQWILSNLVATARARARCFDELLTSRS